MRSRRARFDAQALRAARNGVLISVIADVVRAYVDLRGYQVDLGVLRQAGDVLRESQRIVNQRYERGITNELDVTLATRELETLDAEIAPAGRRGAAPPQNALAVLLGEYPEDHGAELAEPAPAQRSDASIAPGVPLDLSCKRRPDVDQAERELGAATARIGVATADLFPQVALVGAIGAQQGQGVGHRRARRRQAHMVLRAGRDVAAARFRCPRRAGGYRRPRGARESRELPPDAS